ncbi:MAG: ClbS/DfsB family four-helix bundle protein [Anaerolineae bacterium]|nr:ClbS/DfsB family four-helix bundle protein [Anaerolineae bacterium]NIN93943.1 ClbS/DfsB family four-helix bundle protein [Anaerolineae bacterium]NIQ76972.1 ClbS/DfsB family four-helix bundle protein [Anaerolineae bacterium]
MSTQAQQEKDQIISDLIEARRKILNVAYTLPLEKRDEVFLGLWSVRDLLAHLVGWDYTNIDAVTAILNDALPEFYAHHDRDWKTYNERLVGQYKKDDYVELLYSVENSHRELIDFLVTVPADEFETDRGIRFRRYKVTIARLLQAEAEDEMEHHGQIRLFAQGGTGEE